MIGKHPSVEDWATTYTKAIHLTNPDIIQVADKWHFLKNLLTVVKETISSRFPLKDGLPCLNLQSLKQQILRQI